MSAALAPRIATLVDSDKNGLDDGEKKQVKAISQIASMLLAGAAGSDVDVAFESATNEVTNNYLNHVLVNKMKTRLAECPPRDNACREKIRNTYSKLSKWKDNELSSLCGKDSNVEGCGKKFKEAVWYLSTGIHENYNGVWNLWNDAYKKTEYDRGYKHAAKTVPFGPPSEFGLFTDDERRANLMLGGIFGNEGSILEGLGVSKGASAVLGNVNPKDALGNALKGATKGVKKVVGRVGGSPVAGGARAQAGHLGVKGNAQNAKGNDVAKGAGEGKTTGKTAKDNKIFTEKETFDAPSGRTYTFHGQKIDLNLKFNIVNKKTGKVKTFTNREWMKRGNNPYVRNKDGKAVETNQHHSQQDARGPIFEVKVKTHTDKNNQKPLHPYKQVGDNKHPNQVQGNKNHPDHPVDHKNEWNKDRIYINKTRVKKLEENGE